MKHSMLTMGLIFSLLMSGGLHAQLTRGISTTAPIDGSVMTNELFGSKKRRQAKERNQRLRDQNERLERDIDMLEKRLDNCMDDLRKKRYPKRRKRRNMTYDMTNDFWGEKKIDREYEWLKEENLFLRDQRNWLRRELDECQDRYYRDDYRDRRDRGRDKRDRDCNCRDYDPCKKNKKRYKWDDD